VETFVADAKGIAGTGDYTMAIITAVYICARILNFNRDASALLKTVTFMADAKGFA
jgi:hypothetical protein